MTRITFEKANKRLETKYKELDNQLPEYKKRKAETTFNTPENMKATMELWLHMGRMDGILKAQKILLDTYKDEA